jgi:hypothetical protein
MQSITALREQVLLLLLLLLLAEETLEAEPTGGSNETGNDSKLADKLNRVA